MGYNSLEHGYFKTLEKFLKLRLEEEEEIPPHQQQGDSAPKKRNSGDSGLEIYHFSLKGC
jgi:hypothetical protein